MAPIEYDEEGQEALLRMMFGKSAELIVERLPKLLKAWGLSLNKDKKPESSERK